MSHVVEIPVGPQHPALHEPILFRLLVEGERIVRVVPSIGYNHRGIEKLAETNTFVKGLYICGRVCGICNIVHATTYTMAIERIQGVEVPPRARYLRVLVNELERIHSHMLIVAVMAEVLGFESLFMLIMRDREAVMQLKELVTGNRVLGDYLIFGGVRRDIDDAAAHRILRTLDHIEERVRYYRRVFEEDVTINKRLRGVGPISRAEAVRYCLVGPTARGSGVETDVRAEDPYEAYGELEFNVVTYPDGDSWSRMMVRIDEILESIEIIRQVLKRLPQGQAVPKTFKRALPKGEAIARAEAPRGELVYHVISDGKPTPYRVKIRTPSMANVINGIVAFKDAYIADAPAIIASFDPCISCMERVVEVVDLDKRKSTVVSLRELAGWRG